ncbi:MAG: hypothetical protein HY978_00495 [Candidatus Liptonbacteria bacterium]|nr:hypothetical protein [Candidatus Liptonbacteria bacterium]
MKFETPGFRGIEAGPRKIAYSKEFRKMLRERRGLIGAAVRLVGEAEEQYRPENLRLGGLELTWNPEMSYWEGYLHGAGPLPVDKIMWGRGVYLKEGRPLKDEKTGLEVVVLGKSNRVFPHRDAPSPTRLDITSYIKMNIGSKSFFVKKSTATIGPGFVEFVNTVKAIDIQKKINIENLEIVEMQLGYQDKRQSWFVAEWHDLERIGFFPIDALYGGRWDDYGRDVVKIFESSRELPDPQSVEYEYVVEVQLSIIRAFRNAGMNVNDT